MKEYVVFRKWADCPWCEVVSFSSREDAKMFVKMKNKHLVKNEIYKIESRA